jgi:hypothetical protein
LSAPDFEGPERMRVWASAAPSGAPQEGQSAPPPSISVAQEGHLMRGGLYHLGAGRQEGFRREARKAKGPGGPMNPPGPSSC